MPKLSLFFKKIYRPNRLLKPGFYGRFGLFLIILLASAWLAASEPLKTQATTEELRDTLNQQLNDIQQQIDQYRAKINNAQSQAKTLKREIQLLSDKIAELELQIKQTELTLRQTQLNIDDKTVEINQQQTRLDREKDLLAQYLRNIYETDDAGLIEIIFSQKKLSDIFSEISALDTIQKKTYDTIEGIKVIKKNLQDQKDDLSQKKDDELELKTLLQAQRAASRSQQVQKNSLLTQTKGEESAFQEMLKKAQADATTIKKQMYLLDGVGLAMTLEEAYKHAKFAADLTGTRPAYLLAVLKQESSWGTNVGTGTWKKDMHKRDQDAFVQICDELNLDPNQMPVSKKPSYGWGGAMGPAQFLPSTWLGYKNQVAQLTGHNPPSPWDINDAFTAAALKLAQAGANQKNHDAEWKAAMIYFAGSRWGKPVYSFYGDAVMDLAQIIQEQLDIMTR